jgi:hypothetical protein
MLIKHFDLVKVMRYGHVVVIVEIRKLIFLMFGCCCGSHGLWSRLIEPVMTES